MRIYLLLYHESLTVIIFLVDSTLCSCVLRRENVPPFQEGFHCPDSLRSLQPSLHQRQTPAPVLLEGKSSPSERAFDIPILQWGSTFPLGNVSVFQSWVLYYILIRLHCTLRDSPLKTCLNVGKKLHLGRVGLCDSHSGHFGETELLSLW